MNLLSIVFIIKIILAVVIIVLPFLTYSQERLERFTHSQLDSPLLFRLYGISVLSLGVVYAFGLVDALNGALLYPAVVAGAVSNISASSAMVYFGAWRQKLVPCVLLGCIGVCLMITLVFPEFMLKPLFG